MNFRLALAALLLVGAGPALARPCPSKAMSRAFELGDYVALGGEFRAFFFGIDVGDDFPSSPRDAEHEWQNNVFLGLRPLFEFYPLDELTFVLEGELRYRWPGWEEKEIEGLDFRPVQALVEYDPGDFRITAGVQGINFGSAALLDQRFLAVSTELRWQPLTVELFGGSTWRSVMRNAANSMWMRYLSQSTAWKFVSTELQENWVAGLNIGLRAIQPLRLRLLYLYSHPFDESIRSHSIALHFGGPIVRRRLAFLLEPLVVIHQRDGYAVPGLVGQIWGHVTSDSTAPVIELRFATSLRDVSERPAAPVYENLSWGLVRRYSLHDGHVAGLTVSWPVSPYAQLFAEYHVQSRDFASLSDELDVGVELAISDLYRLKLAYAGFNLANEARPSHAFYAEMRIVIGE